jgi:hypothetical protein
MCTTYDSQLVEAVVMRRTGSCLGRGCILFSDDVPVCTPVLANLTSSGSNKIGHDTQDFWYKELS